ncbi:MAG: hypothetical protein U5K43_01010 [Halofilum sp. (in: g-proteobacteria)]|nr:hypothetical protein [Halofilum sp. (in: g-proteobacteria)]
MMDARAPADPVGGSTAASSPGVVSAMLKHQHRGQPRSCMNDAMDVHRRQWPLSATARATTSGSPTACPVAITVEGANILTRSMIVFGQGAMRCHPYLIDEIAAARTRYQHAGPRDFRSRPCWRISATSTATPRARLRLRALACAPGSRRRARARLRSTSPP